jgi:hypothetical protein
MYDDGAKLAGVAFCPGQCMTPHFPQSANRTAKWLSFEFEVSTLLNPIGILCLYSPDGARATRLIRAFTMPASGVLVRQKAESTEKIAQ